MFDNPLKSKLTRGENAFGLFAFEFFTPGLAQAAKAAGAEFILLDMEHSGAGIEVMKQQIAYCRGIDITPIVRVPSNQYQFVARALDAGAHGIMVPMVETADQARDIVRWSKYPPEGRRGAVLGAAHDDYTGGAAREKLLALNDRCMVMLQVETEIGLSNVEAISEVPGVDSICIGFLDLSNFLGVPGETHHPTYLAAIERIAAAAKKHKKILGTAAPDEAFAREYVARGFQFICFGTDVFLLQSALAQRIKALRGDWVIQDDGGAGAAVNLKGWSGNDFLQGGAGAARIEGGGGLDLLDGGGSDIFMFNSTSDGSNVAHIASFSGDLLEFDSTRFTALTPGALSAKEFANASEAQTAAQHLIYDQNVGKLYYDPDGNGAAHQELIAVFHQADPVDNTNVTVV